MYVCSDTREEHQKIISAGVIYAILTFPLVDLTQVNYTTHVMTSLNPSTDIGFKTPQFHH